MREIGRLPARNLWLIADSPSFLPYEYYYHLPDYDIPNFLDSNIVRLGFLPFLIFHPLSLPLTLC